MKVKHYVLYLVVLFLTTGLWVAAQDSENKEKSKNDAPAVVKKVDSKHLASAIVDVGCRRKKGGRSRRVGTGGILVDASGLVLVTDLNRIYPEKPAREAGVKIVDQEYTVSYKGKDYKGTFYAKMEAINLGIIKITNAPDDLKFDHVEFTEKKKLKSGDRVIVMRSHSDPPKKYEFTIRGGRKSRAGHMVYRAGTHLARPPHMLLDLHVMGTAKKNIVGLVSAAPARQKSKGLTTHRGRPRIILYTDFKDIINNPEKHKVNSGKKEKDSGTGGK